MQQYHHKAIPDQVHRLLCCTFTACLVALAVSATAAVGNDTAQTNTLNAYAAEAWEEARDRIVDILDLQEERRELPASAWLRRDQDDVNDDINALLDDVLDTLELSALTDYRAEYAELGDRIRDARVKLRHLHEAQLGADEKKTLRRFFRLTKDGYAKRIEDLEQDIASMQSEREALVEKLREEYARMGVTLSTEQVRFYLASVSGRDIMALSAVFENVRTLSGRLEALLQATPGDPEAARRYYGIHVVMIKAVVKAHETILTNVRERYLPRIAELAERNAAVRQETAELLESASPSQRRILDASRRAQDTTDAALSVYREHLENVRAQVTRGLEAVRTRYRIARNAYDTISISSALVTEMRAAVEDLAALRDMHLPELVPFDNAAIEQKFDEITATLAAE